MGLIQFLKFSLPHSLQEVAVNWSPMSFTAHFGPRSGGARVGLPRCLVWAQFGVRPMHGPMLIIVRLRFIRSPPRAPRDAEWRERRDFSRATRPSGRPLYERLPHMLCHTLYRPPPCSPAATRGAARLADFEATGPLRTFCKGGLLMRFPADPRSNPCAMTSELAPTAHPRAPSRASLLSERAGEPEGPHTRPLIIQRGHTSEDTGHTRVRH